MKECLTERLEQLINWVCVKQKKHQSDLFVISTIMPTIPLLITHATVDA